MDDESVVYGDDDSLAPETEGEESEGEAYETDEDAPEEGKGMYSVGWGGDKEARDRAQAKAREYSSDLKDMGVEEGDITTVYDKFFKDAKAAFYEKLNSETVAMQAREKAKLRRFITDMYGEHVRVSDLNRVPGFRQRYEKHINKRIIKLVKKLQVNVWNSIQDRLVGLQDLLNDGNRPSSISRLRFKIQEGYRQLREWYLEENDEVTQKDVADAQESLTKDEALLRIALRVQTLKEMRAF